MTMTSETLAADPQFRELGGGAEEMTLSLVYAMSPTNFDGLMS